MLFKKKEQSTPFECEHIYNKYVRMADPKRMCITMYLKCYKCGKSFELNVTSGLLADLFHDISENGIISRR